MIRYTNPGLWRASLVLALVNFLLGLDSLFRADQERSNKTFKTMVLLLDGHMWLLVVLHWLAALLIVLGSYRNLNWFRYGAIISFATFNALAVSFGISAAQNSEGIFYGTVMAAAMGFGSAAVAWAPRWNPATAKVEKAVVR